ARGADATDAAGANSARAKAPVPVVARLGDRVLLPDLRGLTREQVQRLARGEALAVDLQGRGRVVAQHPAPGTIFRPGQARLTVQLAPGRRGG
ncbi:MAG: PASTA domain-containing protein, partial [Deltaproteobacteria bacterium]|nr:PASTA domain-containing protein [Deltaproteobacteria bacterium]